MIADDLHLELVLCTRHRPDEVDRCLRSLERQTRVPDVIVVDSSEDPRTRSLIETWAGRFPAELRYVPSSPGLAHQRNHGLRELAPGTDIVLFIDDDVVLEPGYVAAVAEVFAAAADVGGVGGTVTDQPPHRPHFLGRMLLIDSRREGVVLRSGRNVIHGTSSDDEEVEWLPGCAMSYRREALEEERFDERLRGYSLGEDLDLSFRVGRRWRLVRAGGARLRHLESPRNRHAVRDVWRLRARVLPPWVAEQRERGLRVWAFWVSHVGQALVSLAAGVAGRDPQGWDVAKGALQGVVDVLRHGTDRSAVPGQPPGRTPP